MIKLQKQCIQLPITFLLIVIAVSMSSAQEQKELKILSFNTWGLPINLSGTNQSDRFDSIIDSLNQVGSDIICLQECFNKQLRKKIKASISQDFYSQTNIEENRSIYLFFSMDVNGGLATLSKHPIIYEQFFKFPRFKGMQPQERIAEKGFLFTQIKTPVGIVNVVNTHMHAGNSEKVEAIRMGQLQFMFSILQSMDDYYIYPTFLVGDLNITHPQVSEATDRFSQSTCYDYLIQQLGFMDSQVILSPYCLTYDCTRNPFSKPKYGPQKYDYILYKPCRKNEIKTQYTGLRFDKDIPISDHFGYEAIFEFNPKSTRTEREIVKRESKDSNDSVISP